MIESNVIEWLDFGDSVQNLDVYTRKNQIHLFRFFRALLKTKNFPTIMYAVFLTVYFVQIWTIILINVSTEKEFSFDILYYLRNITILFENIASITSYKIMFIIILVIIVVDLFLILFALFSNKKINTKYICKLINLINIIMYYYLIGPAVEICLTSVYCEDKTHKYLKVTCFSNKTHLIYTILSFISLIIYIFIIFVYSFYCNEIGAIKINDSNNTIRIECNYEIYCLVSKVSIFIFGFFFYKCDYEEDKDFLFKILYECFIFVDCLIMSIYTFKNVYFYNEVINVINHYGWFLSAWFSFGVILKTIFNIIGISNFIVIGWIIIIYTFNRVYKLKENSLLTKTNVFEFSNHNLIEKYRNILLKRLEYNYDNESKIFIFGIINKFEEFISNNPEISYQYQKLINNEYLKKKYNKEDSLPILSIIYLIYTFFYEKALNKDFITFYMCYFLINKFNNVTYACLLCSKLKSEGHKKLYYKYLLTEDIKEYLLLKLNKKAKKESINQIQLGSSILYYLYIDLFKLKVYDAICTQIDYFDLLKNSVTTNKTTENILKSGENIFKIRKEILTIWNKIINLNPFCDDCHGDYMLYLDNILQDEILVREETKKYQLLKNNKSQEKYSIYHTMFIRDTSTILLVDGYLSTGKIIYASPNFSLLFMYSGKELTSLTIDDLLPNIVQTFHKELIDNAIKISNVKYIFKEPRDSLIKNKIGGLVNIKLFVKPVPNLSYGLIYFTYIQKIHEPNFNILLDKDFKVNGFTETAEITTEYTVNNGFDLSYNIIGNHIGIVIPDILSILEYKDEEFNITKTDCELKGNLYSVEKVKDLKYKIDTILEKIRKNKSSGEENDPQNIKNDLNSLINSFYDDKIKSFSIFYKVKLYTFLEGKYKYYKVFINNDMMKENEIISINEEANIGKTVDINKLMNIGKNKTKESEKKIKIFMDEKNSKNGVNKNDKIEDNTNGNKNNKSIMNELNQNQNHQDVSDSNKNNDNMAMENKEKPKEFNDINSLFSGNNKSSFISKDYNKIKIDIINNKETFPLKMMKYLCYIFAIVTIVLMIIEFTQQKSAFNRLGYMLSQDLYFNEAKINIAALYTIGVNIRWLSHSLFRNSKSHLNSNWGEFLDRQLQDNLDITEVLKTTIASTVEEFNEIINEQYEVEVFYYKSDEPQKFKYNLKNIFYSIVNNEIKIKNKFNYFINNDCKEIPRELGVDEINLKNMIEQSYFFYNLNLKVYSIEEIRKNNIDNKYFFYFPFSFIISAVILLFLLFFFLYYIISLFNMEIYFLDKLINFNSTNFEIYLKKLDEIKKKLRNDTSEEEEKGEDMNLKDDEDGEGTDVVEKKQLQESHKAKNKKKDKNKNNKIQQQRKKKLNVMTKFFKINLILFLIKLILILFSSMTYYILCIFIKEKYKNKLIYFYKINEALDKVFKDSYDIFLYLKRKVEIYENSLINCETIGDFEPIKIKKVGEINSPTFGNIIMDITGDNDFDENTKDQFSLLFEHNVCESLLDNSPEMQYCESFWFGVLLKGLEQAIIQMDVILSSVLDELNSLNDDNNKTLLGLMSDSSFIEYSQFNEFYLVRAFNMTYQIILNLRQDKLDSIIKKMRLILVTYLIISLFLFSLMTYFVYNFNALFSSFLNFIGIFPPKYLYEDENFYKEIVKFGEKYF